MASDRRFGETAILRELEPSPRGSRRREDTGRRRWYVNGRRVTLAVFIEAANHAFADSPRALVAGRNRQGFPCAVWARREEVTDD